MNHSGYQFHVYSPPKGLVLLLLLLAICILTMGAMDNYGPIWLAKGIWRSLILVSKVLILMYWFTKLAISPIQVKIDHDGLWIEHLPSWSWNRLEHRRVGWLELDRWIYRKGKSDGHGIWWDRLTFKLSDGSNILILPVDDLDKKGDFKTFLIEFGKAVQAYNNRPSTQIPIETGPATLKISIMAWIGLVISLGACVMTVFGIYIMLEKGNAPAWLIFGCFLMLFAFAYQCWNQAKTIRNTMKS